MFRLFSAAFLTAMASSVAAQPAGVATSPWQTFLQGGAVHQFEADLDQGGSYSVTRASVEAGLAYATSRRDSLGVSVGYSLDDYSFDNATGAAASNPWSAANRRKSII